MSDTTPLPLKRTLDSPHSPVNVENKHESKRKKIKSEDLVQNHLREIYKISHDEMSSCNIKVNDQLCTVYLSNHTRSLIDPETNDVNDIEAMKYKEYLKNLICPIKSIPSNIDYTEFKGTI
jgi:hypothetical protein